MTPGSTRREAAARSREPQRPLMTHAPLDPNRERKPASVSRKKRKPATPTKPAMTYDPKDRHVPCGLQDPPVSPSTAVLSRPSEPLTDSCDEPHMDPRVDRDVHEYGGHDAPRQHRFFPGHTSTVPPSASYSNTCTEANDTNSAPDMYDSPVSHTSSSSPAPSDQFPDFASVEYTHHSLPPSVMYSSYAGDGPYVHQPGPVVHHYIPVDVPSDRHAQSFPPHDSPFGRAASHGSPGNNGYPYNNIAHRF